MTTNAEALDQLVTALIESTRAGKTSWEPVGAHGSTFQASRRGGSVLLHGPPAHLGFGALSMGGELKIEVKDNSGNTLDSGQSPGVATGAFISAVNSVQGLQDLWVIVQQQRAENAARIQKLAQEFGG